MPLLVAAQTLPSCGSDEEGKACNPGDIRRCPCSGEPTGEQTCNAEGSGYDECSCDATAVGNGGSGGSSSSSTGGSSSSSAGSSSMPPPVAMFTTVVGSPCTADTACGGDPLFCVESTSNDVFQNQEEGGVVVTGGPQGGYCTARCSSNEDCTALDELSLCNNALGICMGVCFPGMNNTGKCGGDRAQLCLPISEDGQLGICIPRCTSDAGCGGGRFCDTTLFGMCIDAARPGGGVGAPCTRATEAADCASGLCVEYSDPANPAQPAGAFCSANCTAGLLSGCGFDQGSAGSRQAACFAPQIAGGGPGDLGYCAPLCDTTADCAQAAAGWVCEPVAAQIAMQTGRLGECVPGVLATGGAADAGPG